MVRRQNSSRLFSLTLLVALLTGSDVVTSFVLEGSDISYVRFPKWLHQFENTISFEFRTTLPAALLLYTDDGGKDNFYELSLSNGRLWLRLKVGRNASRHQPMGVLEIHDRRLNDDQWHKVMLYHYWENVRLSVDDAVGDLRLKQDDFVFGHADNNSDVFVGGLPPDYPLTRLSSPLSRQLPRFGGQFRNLVYRTRTHGVTAPHLLQIEGARMTDDDHCQKEYCHNGGQCYNTDEGPRCNCNHTDFVGTRCMTERRYQEATFYGGEYVVYDLSRNRNGFVSNDERLSFRFRTRHANGMLFFCGDNMDYLHVAMKDGVIVATTNVGGGAQTVRAAPPSIDPASNKSVFAMKFNDNVWHTAVVRRRLKRLTVAVDGKPYSAKDLPGAYEQLSSVIVYIGGAPAGPASLLNKYPQSLVTSNYIGCLSKVHFNVSGRVLDFLEMAKTEPTQTYLRVYGNLSYDSCREKYSPEPLSFFDSDGFLSVEGWQAAAQGSISFQFRTNEPDGLLLFNGPAQQNQSDYVAFELLDGHVYMVLNLGSGSQRLQCTVQPVNDQQWHTVTVYRDGREGRIIVDSQQTDFSTPGRARRLDLGSPLYIGGLPWSSGFSTSLYSATLRRGFVGCFRDLRLNGLVIDLLLPLLKRNFASIQLGCSETLAVCPSGPCKNDGVCREGYNRFVCDCTPTFYDGRTCESQPLVVDFRAGQFVLWSLTELVRSEADDVSVKFRTRKASCLLVSTASKRSAHYFRLSLVNGALEYRLELGRNAQRFIFGSSLSDDRWHTALIKRRGRQLQLIVDRFAAVTAEISGPLLVLSYDQFWAGNMDEDRPFNHAFEGQMASFRLNHYQVFEEAALGERQPDERRRHQNVKSTATFGVFQPVYEHPVMFSSRHGFLALPIRSSAVFGASFQLSFQFRTFESDGLLFYSDEENSKNFIAVQLRDGKIVYAFNSRNGPEMLQSNAVLGRLNDFRWHAVQIDKRAEEQTLTVNNMTVRLPGRPMVTQKPDFKAVLYAGGAEAPIYKRTLPGVVAGRGFKGCLASVKLNGASVKLLNDAVSHMDVRAGCSEPSTLCQQNTCANGGSCVQSLNNIRCDCSLTTYTGSRCEDASTSYAFGPGPGVIAFEHKDSEEPSTSNDVLVLGLKTNQTSEATILRLDSVTSDDFLAVEMMDGYVSVVFDVGSGEHRIIDYNYRINDNRYHVLKFTRSGQNSTLRINDGTPIKQSHSQDELQVFNKQKRLQIGGRLIAPFSRQFNEQSKSYYSVNKRRSLIDRVERPYMGSVSGLFFNELMPLELASMRDPRIIMIDGDVIMVSSGNGPSPVANIDQSSLLNRGDLDMPNVGQEQQDMTMPSYPNPDKDDLLSSGDDEEGSGKCNVEQQIGNEKNCVIEEPDPTDLITPTMEPRIRPSSTTPAAATPVATTTTEKSNPGGRRPEVDILLPYLTSRPATTTRAPPPTPRLRPTSATTPVTSTTVEPLDSNVLSEPSPARPTVRRPSDESGKVQTAITPLESDEKPGAGTHRTAIISSVAVGVIVAVVLIVFIVFKCRNRASSGESYSTVEETKQYATLYTGSTDGQSPEMAGSKSLITTRVTHVNGFAKNKKDVKEWYV